MDPGPEILGLCGFQRLQGEDGESVALKWCLALQRLLCVTVCVCVIVGPGVSWVLSAYSAAEAGVCAPGPGRSECGTDGTDALLCLPPGSRGDTPCGVCVVFPLLGFRPLLVPPVLRVCVSAAPCVCRLGVM